MEIYTEKVVWVSTDSKTKKVELKLAEKLGVLYITTKDKNYEAHYDVELYNGAVTRKQIRGAAKWIVEHFGLSYAEQNAVARKLRRFVAN